MSESGLGYLGSAPAGGLGSVPGDLSGLGGGGRGYGLNATYGLGTPGLLSSALGGGFGPGLGRVHNTGLGSVHNTAPGGDLSVGNRYASMPGHPSTPKGLLAKTIDTSMAFGIRWSTDLITHLIETSADMPPNSEILHKVNVMREELERVRAHLLDTWKGFVSSQEEQSVDR